MNPIFSAMITIMKRNRLSSLLQQLVGLALLVALTACASPGNKKSDYVGVSIRSLNYSAREVAYISVERPGEPNSGGGGDALNPYSGGGVICCFAIPPVWHPDLKVVVEYQLYPEKEYRKALVSVPPYANGIPSQIWLIVHEDESVEAVVSRYGPSRPEWPGKVKGDPVPSREYRVKLWEEKVSRTKSEVMLFEKQLGERSKESLEETWKHWMKYHPEELKQFTGPSDPAFAEHLKNVSRKGLELASKRLQFFLENKP